MAGIVLWQAHAHHAETRNIRRERNGVARAAQAAVVATAQAERMAAEAEARMLAAEARAAAAEAAAEEALDATHTRATLRDRVADAEGAAEAAAAAAERRVASAQREAASAAAMAASARAAAAINSRELCALRQESLSTISPPRSLVFFSPYLRRRSFLLRITQYERNHQLYLVLPRETAEAASAEGAADAAAAAAAEHAESAHRGALETMMLAAEIAQIEPQLRVASESAIEAKPSENQKICLHTTLHPRISRNHVSP